MIHLGVSQLDPWVGPRLKARHLDDSLRAIKPKNTRVVVKRRRDMQKINGMRIQGFHKFTGTTHTIVVHPDVEKETIAHEFGHAALKHKAWTKVSIAEHMKRELNAWRWAAEHWAEPNNVRSGILKDRKRWIAHVIYQTMHGEKTDFASTCLAAERQMRVLKMEPLTEDEAKWVIREVKYADRALRKMGWEPKYSL